MTIAVLCAAGVGTVGGGLTALHVSQSPTAPAPTRGSAIAAPALAAASTPPPVPPTHPSAQPHAPDPHAVLVIQIRAVLGRVTEWSRSHPGAPCPDAATLGIAALDPWGHPIELTCTDQPADQIMGALSAGPDGLPGNADDVKSWNLGPSVTQLVQGSRWSSQPVAPVATKPPSRHRKPASSPDRILPHSPAPPASTPSIAPSPPIDAGDDIPTRR